ncbi:hypothetical protein INT48_006020 [Thamnidium elegans]|uniref:Uncharacterized protein n=1 Tax=Thamnidium elegans TaxID=101142 RepID=A0A8H7VN80_9FUNG|nr:hypothetical protein INT48_006020 [Thamnidium elegans]
MFSDQYLNACSENSLIVKYWGTVFETFFPHTKDIFIQWGDTISPGCKSKPLNFRLDLRIIVNYGEKVDLCNGEFARKTLTAESKFYYDKEKAVLAAKCFLNKVITSCITIPSNVIPTIKIPIIQIMGLCCHVYTLSIIDKGLYLLQNLTSFSYPRTHIEVRKGGIIKMIDSLSMIEVST